MQILSNVKYALHIAELPKFSRLKSGLRNTMVTSGFRPEVEIRPLCACAMKHMQCDPYLWTNRRNFRVLYEIWVETTMMTSDLRAQVEIWPFRVCAMHPAIII